MANYGQGRVDLPRLSRRDILWMAPAVAASLLGMRSVGPACAQHQSSAAADYSIRIAPTSLEIAPGKIIRTTAYNGTVPGPTLRLKDYPMNCHRDLPQIF
jgi:hypothetical protein